MKNRHELSTGSDIAIVSRMLKKPQTNFIHQELQHRHTKFLPEDQVTNSHPFTKYPYLNVHDLEAARGLSSCTSIESARYLHASFSLASSLVLVSLFLLERQFMHCPGKGRWSSMCVPHSACRAMARPQKPIRRSFWFWGQMQPQVYFWAYS